MPYYNCMSAHMQALYTFILSLHCFAVCNLTINPLTKFSPLLTTTTIVSELLPAATIPRCVKLGLEGIKGSKNIVLRQDTIRFLHTLLTNHIQFTLLLTLHQVFTLTPSKQLMVSIHLSKPISILLSELLKLKMICK